MPSSVDGSVVIVVTGPPSLLSSAGPLSGPPSLLAGSVVIGIVVTCIVVSPSPSPPPLVEPPVSPESSSSPLSSAEVADCVVENDTPNVVVLSSVPFAQAASASTTDSVDRRSTLPP